MKLCIFLKIKFFQFFLSNTEFSYGPDGQMVKKSDHLAYRFSCDTHFKQKNAKHPTLPGPNSLVLDFQF